MVTPADSRSVSERARKLLVVVDGTEECERALRFAVRRAARTGSRIALLYVMAPMGLQYWLKVSSLARGEAEGEARSVLERFAASARQWADVEVELILREGDKTREITRLVEEDAGIVDLLLAAARGSEGPGPIISSLVSRVAGRFPVPITIVPGSLSDGRIDVLA